MFGGFIAIVGGAPLRLWKTNNSEFSASVII
ncbi:MAG: hypothetical protein UW94_C0001G0081 [Parcubacteria group bacterium GW2011_GWA2_45_14]|nr:MAG: hypothetical protein UW94_C0001G0081 [Parcubacteria group bacterium GW2011_GWA2_45_14]